MNVSGIDAQDTAEMSEFEGVFSTLGLLFEVAGQAAVSVRASAEGGLEYPFTSPALTAQHEEFA